MLRHDLQSEASCGHGRVDRSAVSDVHRDAGRPDPARDDERGHVSEGDGLDGACLAPDPREDPPRRHVDGHLGLAVGRRLHTPRFNRPGPERAGAVPARCRVAVRVPEQHAAVRARIVGGNQEAAIRVGVSTRLMAEKLADGVHRLVGGRPLAALTHAGARYLRDARGDDPERLAGRVVVGADVLQQSGRPKLLARYVVKRFTKASAMSATSCQPLSIVKAWPRPLISTISVTPGLRFCRLNEAFAIAHGTVWSFSPEMMSKGPRSGLIVLTFASVQGLMLAPAA